MKKILRLFLVSKNGKYGYVNEKNKIIIPCEYDFLLEFNSGFAYVEKDNKSGYMDKKNKMLKLKKNYDSLEPFYNGIAIVEKNGKKGCIDTTGREIIPCEYDFITYLLNDRDLILIEKNDKCGYADKTGRIVIPFEYDDLDYFREGLAAAKLNGKWGYIDKKTI